MHEFGSTFYGWSTNKKIVKAFIQQRGEGKYNYKAFDNDEIEYSEFSSLVDDDHMIKLLLLPSVSNNERYPLFITDEEAKETEKQIHTYFSDLASFDNYKSRSDLIRIFYNLKKEAKIVLENIGCVPSDFNDMGYMESESSFPTLYDEIDTLIDEAYLKSPTEYDFDEEMEYMPKGHYRLNDFHSKYCYSLEAFIKILQENF